MGTFNGKRDRGFVYKYAPGDDLIVSKGEFICYTHSWEDRFAFCDDWELQIEDGIDILLRNLMAVYDDR